MNISTFGSRFYGGQIDRLDDAFVSLGHTVNNGGPDIIYCNDAAHFGQAIAKWHDYGEKPKLILNILDIPSWLPEWPIICLQLKSQLSLANYITCISKTVQNDIKQLLDLDSHVIYNPIKPISYIPDSTKDILALFVGRALAPNKRILELVKPLSKLLLPYFGGKCIHFVGSENPGFGTFHGVVSDEELNILYNKSLFTLISSRQEGLNLPMIESVIGNSIPIIARDMSTADELAPPELLCDPTPEAFFIKMRDIGNDIDKYMEICKPYAFRYSEQFSPKSVASRILSFAD